MSQNPEAERPRPSDDTANGDSNQSADTQSVSTQRAYAYWLVTLAIVLSGSLMSLSWYGWQLFETNSNRINALLNAQQENQAQLQQLQQQDHAELSALRAELDQNQGSLNTALNAVRAETATKTAQAEAQIQALDRSLERLQDQLGRGTLAWQAQDINTLLTRAQEQISIDHDPVSAAAALSLADQRLAALNRPDTLPVRAAISDALQGLQRADAFDAVGMSLALRRAADSARDLPLKGETAPVATTPDSPPAAADAPWYIRWPQAVWHPISTWLSEQIIITRDGVPFGDRGRHLTDQELRLWLTGVREALMTGDQHRLLAAVAQATDWLDGHYDPAAPAVKALKNQLTTTADFYQHRARPDLAPVFRAWQATGLMSPPVTAPSLLSPSPEAKP